MTTFTRFTRRSFLTRTLAAGAALAGTPLASTIAQAAGGSPAWQIGIYTRPWGKFDYRVALDAMAEAGFKYAGLMTTNSKSRLVISAETTPEEAAQVRDELKKRRLGLLSVYGGGIPVQKSLEAGIEAMRRLLDNCVAAGSKSILMGGIGSEKLEEPYYKAIAECCDYAAEKGMTIALKPHGPLNATGPQCAARAKMVNKKNFRLYYDPGNICFYSKGELDPVKDCESVDGLVCGMCVKDYLPPGRVDVTPGTGKVNFPALMARLKKGGFTGGPLVIECLAPGDEKALVAEAKKAREFVEKLVRG